MNWQCDLCCLEWGGFPMVGGWMDPMGQNVFEIWLLQHHSKSSIEFYISNIIYFVGNMIRSTYFGIILCVLPEVHDANRLTITAVSTVIYIAAV